MQQSIRSELDALKRLISGGEIPPRAKEWDEWGGADVEILSHLDQSAKDWIQTQPMVISAQTLEPKRRVIVTGYSRELSWLFCQLRDIFSEQIDYVSKYDFYGSLAQSAIDYLNHNQGTETLAELLVAVVEQSERWLGDNLGEDSAAY